MNDCERTCETKQLPARIQLPPPPVVPSAFCIEGRWSDDKTIRWVTENFSIYLSNLSSTYDFAPLVSGAEIVPHNWYVCTTNGGYFSSVWLKMYLSDAFTQNHRNSFCNWSAECGCSVIFKKVLSLKRDAEREFGFLTGGVEVNLIGPFKKQFCSQLHRTHSLMDLLFFGRQFGFSKLS